MSRVADDTAIRRHFPAIAEALSQAASAQIRNMASMGGNLLQRTRCPYFRDPASFPAPGADYGADQSEAAIPSRDEATNLGKKFIPAQPSK